MRRFRRLFRLADHPNDVNRAVDDELRFHFEMTMRELVARGMSEDAARREAERRFGDVTSARERLRAIDSGAVRHRRWYDAIQEFGSDLRYAARGMRHAPGFAAVVVATLALGIGANATVLGLVDQLLYRPPAHVSDPDRIVLLSASMPNLPGLGQQTFNYPVYKALGEDVHAFEHVAIASSSPELLPLGVGANARNLRSMVVSFSYFATMGVKPARGRFFTSSEDAVPVGAAVVVISDAFWARELGRDPNVLGRTLDIANGRWTIIGVAPPGFTGTEMGEVDAWLPISAVLGRVRSWPDWYTAADGSFDHIFARLRPGATIVSAEGEAARVLDASFGDKWYVKGRRIQLTPMLRTRGPNLGVSRGVTLLVSIMGVIVLLIACTNVANLLVARGLRRRGEIAVRLALGVTRGRLVRMLMAESLLLALVGGGAAVVVAWWAGAALQAILFSEIPGLQGIVDLRIFALTAAVTVCVGLAAGAVPGLQVSRPDLAGTLKSGVREGGGHHARTRTMLLVVQAALSVILLASAGLFGRSLINVSHMDIGVDAGHVLYATMNLGVMGRTPADEDVIFAAARDRVNALPGVAQAAQAWTIPFGPSYGVSAKIPGRDSLPSGNGTFLNAIAPGYFDALGTRLVAGRDFTRADRRGTAPVAIISKAMARALWPDETAVGKCMTVNDVPCTRVVGVAPDIRRQQIIEDPVFFVYVPVAQMDPAAPEALSAKYLVIRPSGDADAMVESVRRAIQTAVPGLPYVTVRKFSDDPDVLEQLRRWRLSAICFGVFGALALAMAAVGLFGVMSYNVTQRLHEIGVRVALGARSGRIARLVIGQAVAITAAGVAIGAVVSLVGGRFAASLLYGVSWYDPLVFVCVAAVLVVVAIVASLLPTRRALRVDPVAALRGE